MRKSAQSDLNGQQVQLNARTEIFSKNLRHGDAQKGVNGDVLLPATKIFSVSVLFEFEFIFAWPLSFQQDQRDS